MKIHPQGFARKTSSQKRQSTSDMPKPRKGRICTNICVLEFLKLQNFIFCSFSLLVVVKHSSEDNLCQKNTELPTTVLYEYFCPSGGTQPFV